MPAWRAMGSPQYLKPDQIDLLHQSAQIASAKVLKLDAAGATVLDLPPEGVALVELI
jgi:xylan 1,4-beta-xylosidase